ncbi:hypothetical protein, partial [Sphingorhabdus sp.]|uniref:hypothetical protein n=1 Tax=Sphingorhabdus sp. TaxID=1902408 RepID=UPI003BB0E9F4
FQNFLFMRREGSHWLAAQIFDLVGKTVALIRHDAFQHSYTFFQPALVSSILRCFFGNVLGIELHLALLHFYPRANYCVGNNSNQSATDR